MNENQFQELKEYYSNCCNCEGTREIENSDYVVSEFGWDKTEVCEVCCDPIALIEYCEKLKDRNDLND